MAEELKRVLSQMIFESAKLHLLIQCNKTEISDESTIDTFLTTWFHTDVVGSLKPLLRDITFPAKVSDIGSLSSIFSEMEVEGSKGETRWIKPDTIDRLQYLHTPPKERSRSALKKHIDMMQTQTRLLEWTSLEDFYARYHALFKTYTSNIGSFSNTPDTTIDFYTQHKIDVVFKDHTTEVHIIEFDISGVQSFIYEVTEGGDAKRQIAKTVRGRSFYLSLLSDFIGYAFLNQFNLPYQYFIMSAGGKGTVAIPKTEDSDVAIKKIQSRIEHMLFSSHQTKLSIAFSVRALRRQHLVGKENYRILDIDQALSSSKKSKFKSILATLDQSKMNAIQNRCILCNAPVDKDAPHCSVCSAAIELSKALVSHEKLSILFDYSNNPKKERVIGIKMGNLGYIHFGAFEALDYEPDTYHVSLNQHRLGDIRYYANVFAKGKSFQEISKTMQGDEKLALIKMDVDNLGLLFLKGLTLNDMSYYKYLTLSRQLDFFFTHELAEICKKKAYNDQIYISYAGGDDLVIVCPAFLSLNLLKDIQDSFSDFTCNNPSIHLSSGIEIFHQKSPFRHAVRFADAQLEKSKDAPGKNHFTVLGTTIDNQHLTLIIEEIDHYVECLNHDILSKSTIQRIYQALLNSLSHPSPVAQFYPYIPLISYMLERNIKKGNENEKIRLKNLFVTKHVDKHILMRYLVVFGYVLLRTRNINRKEVQ